MGEEKTIEEDIICFEIDKFLNISYEYLKKFLKELGLNEVEEKKLNCLLLENFINNKFNINNLKDCEWAKLYEEDIKKKDDYNYIKNVYIIELKEDTEYEKLLNNISKLTHERVSLKQGDDFLKKLMKNKKDIDIKKININVLGNYKSRNRFAAPVYVTFWENKDKKYMIIKELNYNYIFKKLGIVIPQQKEIHINYINNFIKCLKSIVS
jgi:CRISPR-associated protein Cmr1